MVIVRQRYQYIKEIHDTTRTNCSLLHYFNYVKCYDENSMKNINKYTINSLLIFTFWLVTLLTGFNIINLFIDISDYHITIFSLGMSLSFLIIQWIKFVQYQPNFLELIDYKNFKIKGVNYAAIKYHPTY